MNRVTIGSWDMNLTDKERVFPSSAIDAAQELLKRWAKVFPLGQTWVGSEYGVPSLITRVDCVLGEDNELRVYEIEDRPCGAGMLGILSDEFLNALSRIRVEWPTLQWVEDERRLTDDELWLGPGISFSEALRSNDKLLIRTRPDYPGIEVLEGRAVAPVLHEGDKGYGVPLGLWSLPTYTPAEVKGKEGTYEDLPCTSCCIKPMQGTRGHGIGFFLDDEDLERYRGACEPTSLKSLKKRIRQEGVYCQPLIPPMEDPDYPGFGVMYRFFFGYSPGRKAYVPLGGAWLGSKSLLIHGTPETITGYLRPED